ncbi:peptidoglycan D,D-transpeptidase FtsI family protein [Faecalibacterium langellae]|uniref:Peptidase n=1 Tax=Faecalibacterium langellae TaxID=3435293 RepID=A0ACC9CWX2_9FIRM|nr:penicillin-binding transpeptidase domain-containing protein [Faecalibacterium prausnitzii]PDX60302.1 peptidase [Faecalibacterium prausnitzii]
MNQNERKTVVRRMILLIAAACAVMGLFVLRLIFLQLVNGDDFKAQATNTTDYNFTVTAARGDIVDSSGRRIATSTTSYNVVLNKLLMGDRDLDTMLQQIVELLRENGESWNDTLLIGQPDAAGHYEFTDDDTSTSDQKQLADMKDTLGLQQYATADDVMEMLVEKNNLQGFSLEWQRVLAGIHYEMDRQAFSNVNNFVMAENVSAATVATIKEHSLQLPGVEIVETSARSYEQSDIIPAVLGRVGKITAEKWKVTDSDGNVTYPLRDKGYNMNDILGISGLESAYEDELRGKDGVETITRNSDGVIVDTQLTTVPEPGHTVQLTIDSNFQRAVDKALAENIDMINRVYNTGDMKAAAAAAVVIDVKDGGVLAASNYPSFDQNLYATNYSEYSSDPGLPLFNRALQGLYTPGSTFKPAVAVAALDSGLINQYSTVFCNGVYNYFKDYHPKCTRHGHSGNIDVVTAIKWSCNIFFYDVGRRLTSDVYDAYAYKLGLGQRTGVEVSEATGRLTTKNDSNYTASLDVQAAIGQGNTVVTPIQLATYAATLANNGVRYRTHFVKAILDTNTGEVLSETQPEVMDVIEGTGNTFELVREGMKQVPSTISGKISSYPIAIACKTGTPQRSETYAPGKHYLNAMMVAYLPADDPEIAIGISIEYGGYGARAGDLVVDIANAYFAMKDGTLEKQAEEEAAQSQADQQAADTQQSTGTANGTQTTTGTANAAGTAGTSGTAQPTQTEPAAQPAAAETELSAAEPDTEDNPDAIAPETVPQETG